MPPPARRRLVAAIALLAGAPGFALAQPATRVHRIGMVSVLPGKPEPATVRTLRDALRGLGYAEGKNLVIETRYADGRVERLPALFAELIALKPDVLVTGSVAGALAAKKATTTVPVVFAGVLDAGVQDLVTNLARPGGNLTGTTYGVGHANIAGKWMELLKDAAPRISHVAVLFSSVDPQSPGQVRAVHTAASSMNVKASQFDAHNDATLQDTFAAMKAARINGLIVTNSPFFGGNRSKLVQFAAQQRLPAIYFFNLFPEAGGLMSYGGSIEESYRRAAAYVDKILKGANPGELPIEQASTFELVINLKTAKALGLVLPQTLLVRADRLIE